MSRPFRLLASATALALTCVGATVPVSAASSTLGSPAGDETRVSPARSSASPDLFADPVRPLPAIGVAATSAAPRTSQRAVSRTWPVRQRAAAATYHPGVPSGDLSQRLVSATIVQDRLYDEMYVDVTLQGTPSAATDSRLRVGFGVIRSTDTGAVCATTSKSVGADVHTYGTTDAYEGARIRYRQSLPGSKSETYNCAFAAIISPDGTTVFDAVTDSQLVERRQKPILDFKFKGKRLQPRGFTRVPIRIVNSKFTVATASKVRLKVRSRGVAVRYNPRVGTIKPGQSKRGAIFVKDTRPGTGFVTLIVRSKDYKKKVTVKVREVRR